MCSFLNIESLFKREASRCKKKGGGVSSRFQSIPQFYFPTTDQTKLHLENYSPTHFRSQAVGRKEFPQDPSASK